MSPQNKQILKWMKANKGKWLTTRTAMIKLGIGCLHKRIAEIDFHLWKQFVNNHRVRYVKKVKREWQTVKTRYGKTRVMGYRL